MLCREGADTGVERFIGEDSVETVMAFCDEHADRARVVRYEDLVGAPEERFQDIHRFLGVPDQDGPARFLSSQRINSSFCGRARRSADDLWPGWEENDGACSLRSRERRCSGAGTPFVSVATDLLSHDVPPEFREGLLTESLTPKPAAFALRRPADLAASRCDRREG
jgi:hypothetical protein